MAQHGNQLDWDKYSCSICLDVLRYPVTIPCGHSYCMICIQSVWDDEEQKKTFKCPQCRQRFMPRPVLVKNTMLADLVEDLKKTGQKREVEPANDCHAGSEDVGCDVCIGTKRKALKSCLQCLASYCEQHLQPHYESSAFRKHKLVKASEKLQENLCPRHDEVMKIFCRTDKCCICILCSMDEHKGHDTVSAVAERTERQDDLGATRQQIQEIIQDKQNDVKVLQQEREEVNRSADKSTQESERIFTELISLLEGRRSKVKQQIKSQKEADMSQMEEQQKKLEQEVKELRRKDTELEELSHTEDHCHFLTKYLSCLSESKGQETKGVQRDPAGTKPPPPQYFEAVAAAVSALRDQVQNLSEEWTMIPQTEPKSQAEPKTRAEFLKYSRPMTLDPNTAHKRLLLSEGNKRITLARENTSHTLHPDNFIHITQDMSTQHLRGRCYWEVEKKNKVAIALTYKNISKSGGLNECGFGYNDKSWALHCDKSYIFMHNNDFTRVSGPMSSRVGVYLDHEAGFLSFYSVSESMTLLHRVRVAFTQPIYAGLGLYGTDGDDVELK
ncbi:tripartite motif-containing protein 16-like [Genypterus blacodes]|uniref:tripartite motif-containing protein 16-like n=1 Tax=Genypterus blacodes TaxID=154954 RepID=UPI003F773191